MAVLEFDLSRLAPSVRQRIDRNLRDEMNYRLVQAKARQKQLSKFCRDHPPSPVEGLGALTTVIDPFILSKLRRDHKPAPGEENDLIKWAAKKDKDWLKVRSAPGRIQVGYGPSPAQHISLKFRKTYK